MSIELMNFLFLITAGLACLCAGVHAGINARGYYVQLSDLWYSPALKESMKKIMYDYILFCVIFSSSGIALSSMSIDVMINDILS